MKYLRLLLFPFSLIYGLVVMLRNWFFDAGIFKTFVAGVPVISVGNLDVGGAGKSPMTEYLIRLLRPGNQLATLSRGYGRKTKGFIATRNGIAVNSPSAVDATRIGDEPAQFAQKFSDITVAVCEDRAFGIKQLQAAHNLIILDDAYQHRAVKPGLSILLFDHNRVFAPHLLLPAGNLREPFSGRKRADIIVISKCPTTLTTDEQAALSARINPSFTQPVFFTSIQYLPLQTLDGKPSNAFITTDTTVFLVTGIANPAPLVEHIKKSTLNVIHHNYPDHHRFSLKNISKLAGEFEACTAKNKLIITTEKDAQRLVEHELLPGVKKLPILVVPIGIKFLNNAGPQFDQLIINYVREYK